MNGSAIPPGEMNLQLSVLRSRLAELFLRVADTLDESAQLAEGHARRCQTAGRGEFVDAELESAKKARAAALRGRAASSYLSATGRPAP